MSVFWFVRESKSVCLLCGSWGGCVSLCFFFCILTVLPSLVHSARRSSAAGGGGGGELDGAAGDVEASARHQAARSDPRLPGGVLEAGERGATRTACHPGRRPA